MSETQQSEVESAIEQTLSAGLEEADTDTVLGYLEQELERQTDESRQYVLSGETDEWVLSAGDPAAGEQPGIAARFLSFYTEAIRKEVCDEAGGCLKEKYQQLTQLSDLKSQLSVIAPAILGAISISASLVAPATIAAVVGLWLIRVGLNKWCSNDTSTSMPADPSEPVSPVAP